MARSDPTGAGLGAGSGRQMRGPSGRASASRASRSSANPEALRRSRTQVSGLRRPKSSPTRSTRGQRTAASSCPRTVADESVLSARGSLDHRCWRSARSDLHPSRRASAGARARRCRGSCGPPLAEHLHRPVKLLLELAGLGHGEVVEEAEVEKLPGTLAARGPEIAGARARTRRLGDAWCPSPTAAPASRSPRSP